MYKRDAIGELYLKSKPSRSDINKHCGCRGACMHDSIHISQVSPTPKHSWRADSCSYNAGCSYTQRILLCTAEVPKYWKLMRAGRQRQCKKIDLSLQKVCIISHSQPFPWLTKTVFLMTLCSFCPLPPPLSWVWIIKNFPWVKFSWVLGTHPAWQLYFKHTFLIIFFIP